jgi:hypothetical protein
LRCAGGIESKEKMTDLGRKHPRVQAKNPDETGFGEVAGFIAAARQRAFQAVNTALIDLYWQVGEYIGGKLEAAEWGDGEVPRLAQYIARTQPGQRGFTRSNLFRMKQFYETCRENCHGSTTRSSSGRADGPRSANSTSAWR